MMVVVVVAIVAVVVSVDGRMDEGTDRRMDGWGSGGEVQVTRTRVRCLVRRTI